MTPLGRNQAVKLMLKKFAAEESVAEPVSPFWFVWNLVFRLILGV